MSMNKSRLSIQNGMFFEGNQPVLLMAGEIHYFRLPKNLWEIHLKRLKEMGGNVVSTYVPWLIHEPLEGVFEFKGESLDQYDLGYFLELCQAYHLKVFLRPGPYVMAELHGEGLASYLTSNPDLKPLTWGKVPVPNGQIDLLDPFYLSKVKAYYTALFNFVKPYLIDYGGPIELIQLDNEVGMLAWVSQSPPLTDDIVKALGDLFDKDTYQFVAGMHEIGHHRLGYLLRKRYEDYISKLKHLLNTLVGDVITLINIHGTSGGRGLTFPIGYSQLLNTFKAHVIGTDIYFEQLTLRNAHDFYLINSQLNALKDPNTPSTCLEFNAGNSNFGDNLGGIDTLDSMDKKIRLLFIQGHKLINFYLFSGGVNPLTHPSYKTANGRIAITGERHGFAAPVKLSGEVTPMFHQMKETLSKFHVYGPKLSLQKEVMSNLTLGITLDYYMTDSMRHGTEIESLKISLTDHHHGPWIETFLKQALLLHIPFSTLHLEAQALSVKKHPILLVGTSEYMASLIQEKLVNFLEEGGKIMFVGPLPEKTLEGVPDTRLLDYLGITPKEIINDYTHPLLMIHSDEPIEGYHTFRASSAQIMIHNAYSPYHDLEEHKLSYLTDRVIWLTHHIPGYLYLTQRWCDHLGVIKPVKAITEASIYIFKTQSNEGMLLHLLNFESYDVTVSVVDLPTGEITVKAYDNLMLPINYRLHRFTITSTCELIEADENQLSFDTNGLAQTILIETQKPIGHSYCTQIDGGYQCDIPIGSKTVTLK